MEVEKEKARLAEAPTTPRPASPLCRSRKERSARRAANASREAAEAEEEVPPATDLLLAKLP